MRASSLRLLLLLVPLGACGDLSAGESAQPGAAAGRNAEPPAPVELVAPRELGPTAGPTVEVAGEPEDTAAPTAPQVASLGSDTWAPSSYVPPARGRGRGRGQGGASRGTQGTGAAAAGAPVPADGGEAPAAKSKAKAGSGEATVRRTANNPAKEGEFEGQQNVKKKFTTPYRGKKIRNPENKAKAKGGGGQ